MRVFEVGRVFARSGARTATDVAGIASRCASAGSPTARRCPSNGATARPRRRLLRRQGRPRGAGRAADADDSSGRAPGAASRARRARIDGRRRAVGWLGELHPRLAAALRAARAPVVFELDLDPLLRGRCRSARPVSTLPVVRRDLPSSSTKAVPAQALLDGAGRAPSRRTSIASGCSTSIAAPGLTDGQEKPCDSGAYAGYCTYFDRRRHRRDHGATGCRSSRSVRRARYASRSLRMTLTKAELADLLFEQLGLNKREAKDMVERFFEEIRIALESGRERQAVGLRQLPAARKAAAAGPQPEDRRRDPDHRAARRHFPRKPETEGHGRSREPCRNHSRANDRACRRSPPSGTSRSAR